MKQELKEAIARNAACGWCRCFKCDGIVNDTGLPCDKDRLLTCNQWYHGYRTALLALDDDRINDKDLDEMADDYANNISLASKFPTTNHDLIMSDIKAAFRAGYNANKEKQETNIWHNSNEEQPSTCSSVIVLYNDDENNEHLDVLNNVLMVHPDKKWAYVEDIINCYK